MVSSHDFCGGYNPVLGVVEKVVVVHLYQVGTGRWYRWYKNERWYRWYGCTGPPLFALLLLVWWMIYLRLNRGCKRGHPVHVYHLYHLLFDGLYHLLYHLLVPPVISRKSASRGGRCRSTVMVVGRGRVRGYSGVVGVTGDGDSWVWRRRKFPTHPQTLQILQSASASASRCRSTSLHPGVQGDGGPSASASASRCRSTAPPPGEKICKGPTPGRMEDHRSSCHVVMTRRVTRRTEDQVSYDR